MKVSHVLTDTSNMTENNTTLQDCRSKSSALHVSFTYIIISEAKATKVSKIGVQVVCVASLATSNRKTVVIKELTYLNYLRWMYKDMLFD